MTGGRVVTPSPSLAQIVAARCSWSELASRYSCPPCDHVESYVVRFLGDDRDVQVCAGHVAWLRPLRRDITSIRAVRRIGDADPADFEVVQR